MGCSQRYPGPFILLVPAGSLAPAPWTPPLPGGLLAQPPRLDAKGSTIRCNHSAQRGGKRLVWAQRAARPSQQNCSTMICTRLQRFCDDGCCRVGETPVRIPHGTVRAEEFESPSDGTQRFGEVKYLAGKFSDAIP